MKNQKLLTFAALAGITVGGLSIGSASAQGYGGEQEAPVAPAAVAVDSTTNPSASNNVDQGRTLFVQDTTTPEAEADSNVEGEREGRRGRHGGGCNLEAAAEAIGIDEADLKAAVDGGDSIADVAVANGVPVDMVVDAMVAEKAERIAAKVESGRITQAEADEKLARTEAKITDRVNGSDDSAEL